MMAGLGVVVGRLNRRFSALIPILSTCSSSDVVRVHDSQLLMKKLCFTVDQGGIMLPLAYSTKGCLSQVLTGP